MTFWEKVVFYVPVHANHSQVEHTAPFLTRSKGRVFVYDGAWNTEAKKMTEFYRRPEWSSRGVTVSRFDIRTILECIRSEPPQARVVFLLTASTNYGFGRAQQAALRAVAELRADKVIDVFTVGHCLYGCESCGLSEHAVPVFFSRFARGELPYSADDIRRKFFGDSAGPRILICPSVGETSFLTRQDVLDEIAKLARELGTSVSFAVKLHSFTNLEDEDGARPNVLFTLSAEDRRGARFLRETFGPGRVATDETPNILPFFAASTIVVTDVNSSVPFEALAFPHLTVIAHHDAVTVRHDPVYVSLLNVFDSPAQLSDLIRSAIGAPSSRPVHPVGESGIAFFQSKYGRVDGKEVDRVAEIRRWEAEADRRPAPAATARPIEEELELFSRKFSELVPESEQGPLDFLARGIEIPKHVAEFVVFEATNRSQLTEKKVPQSLWRRLYEKVSREIFDAGNVFQFARLVSEEGEGAESSRLAVIVGAEAGLDPLSDIFIIDHAWTTTIGDGLEFSRGQLADIPGLLERIEGMLGVEGGGEEDKVKRIDRAWTGMWRLNQHYRIAGPDGSEVSCWFVNDELGTRIGHSAEPNCRCVSFVNAATATAFTLLYPISRIEPGELVVRDFVEGTEDGLERSVKLLPYGAPVSDSEPVDSEALAQRLARFRANLSQAAPPPPLPAAQQTAAAMIDRAQAAKRPIRVFSDSEIIGEFLKRPEFVQVGSEAEADVLWLAGSEFADWGRLGRAKFVSQLPGERCLVFKDHLVRTVRRAFGGTAPWLPETFDLVTELPEFIARFQERAAAGQDNTYIIKPYNLARGLEIAVSDDLGFIVRQADSIPKLACKYVERPATLMGRKFDLRFLVFARCKVGWPQVEAFVYNPFWTRFGTAPYKLADFWNYAIHFTVQNYKNPKEMIHMKWPEFIVNFEKEHGIPWAPVRAEIDAMLGKVFQAASLSGIGGGSGGSPCTANSVGVYGVDLLLTSDFHPVLEEVNWSPDCHRACQYNPEFYNEVFGHFFFGEMNVVTRIL